MARRMRSLPWFCRLRPTARTGSLRQAPAGTTAPVPDKIEYMTPKITVQLKVRILKGARALQDAPEVVVFMACRGMVEELRSLAEAFHTQEMTKRVFMARCRAVLARLNEAATVTERFDVVLPVFDYGRFSPF